VDYATGRSIDLRGPPFDATPADWLHPTDYEPCQSIADVCRADGIDVIKYQSARDPIVATNMAILRCRAFANPDPVDRQTWRIQVGDSGARMFCEFPKAAYQFDRAALARDPRIKGMVWER
jgi:hypothetical protein